MNSWVRNLALSTLSPGHWLGVMLAKQSLGPGPDASFSQCPKGCSESGSLLAIQMKLQEREAFVIQPCLFSLFRS